MRVSCLRKASRKLDEEAICIASDDAGAARLVVQRVHDAVALLLALVAQVESPARASWQ